MSWSGTVRCSHCYQRGHNRRSCPQITKHHLDQYASYKRLRDRSAESGNADGANMYEMHMDTARTAYVKRTGLDPATGAKVKRKAAKAERMKNVQCGYCGTLGHTRRICEAVKADYQVYLVETRRVRIAALAKVQDSGIGVGSMVAFKGSGYNSDGNWGTFTKLNYITEYKWETVDAHSRALEVKYVDHKSIHRMHDPYHVNSVAFETLQQRMKEVPEDAPAPSLAGSINPPDGWLDGSRSLKEAFPTTGNRHNKERSYEYRWPSDSKKEVIRSLGLEEHYPNVDS